MTVLSLKQLKFIVVGVLNTLIHFLILNTLVFGFDIDKVLAGVFAALSAMIFSFVANRQYVFRSKSTRIKREIIVFFVGTIIGAFVFNYGTYLLALHGLEAIRAATLLYVRILSSAFFDILQVNLSLVAGSAVALVWNYNFYHRIVFKDQEIGGRSAVIDSDNKL